MAYNAPGGAFDVTGSMVYTKYTTCCLNQNVWGMNIIMVYTQITENEDSAEGQPHIKWNCLELMLIINC